LLEGLSYEFISGRVLSKARKKKETCALAKEHRAFVLIDNRTQSPREEDERQGRN
jgi:hypothetical protein